MNEELIVDGYNIIGAWPELTELKDDKLEEARDRLIDMLADYQGYSGKRVIIVFDAYKVPGLGASYRQNRLEIIYTKEKETADECIERLVKDLLHRRRQIVVATSDYTEQHVAFAQGALRMSARELLIEWETAKGEVRKRLERAQRKPSNTLEGRLSDEIQDVLEKWRRGNSS
jgi:predicted RNA-binding protein with PIN domain